MDWRARTTCRAVILGTVLAVATGCGIFSPARRTVPFEPPTARRLAPADDPGGQAEPGMSLASPVTSDVGMRPPRNVLVLSGGGAFGAFTAGVLAGWTQSGTRPEFDVVTGISTGALLAPFAFIGPEYDSRAKHFYTTIKAEDIYTIRSWLTLPCRSSIASSAPLRRLIESEIDQTLMERIAAEHRKGRRLYVGTTNVDTRRLAVWDLGAIACRPCPEGCALFRDVLLASCSIPGMFPPVTFELDVDGVKATEMHVDGGVSAQLFCPSSVFGAATTLDGANLYMVVSGKLYPDAKPVRERMMSVLAASTTSHVYSHRRGELTNLYGLARASNMAYHLTAVRQDFRTADVAIKFDKDEMNGLYQEGVRHGASGRMWQAMPPELAPGDGDYIRNGLKLRAAPAGWSGP